MVAKSASTVSRINLKMLFMCQSDNLFQISFVNISVHTEIPMDISVLKLQIV